MAWIPNVNPNELIQSAWGNNIRDHVVNTFASAAERNAAIPTPAVGMVTWRTDVKRLEVYRDGLWQPLLGMLLVGTTQTIQNVSHTGVGIRDVVSLAQSTTFPFPTISMANLAGFGGFAGTVNFQYDMVSYAPPSFPVVGSFPGIIQAIGGAWAAGSITATWANAANTETGYKGRINVVQIVSGTTCWSGGYASLQVFAAA